MVKVACPHCGIELEIQEKYIGQQGRCKCCNQVFTAQPIPEKKTHLAPVINQGSGSFIKWVKRGCLYSFITYSLIIFGLVILAAFIYHDQQKPSGQSQSIQHGNLAQSRQRQSRTPAKTQPQSSMYTLTADQLYSEFDANEVAAEAKYKKQLVTVSGVIQNIGTEILGRAYVVIGGRGFLDGVQCVFPDSEKPRIAVLSKGQHVTIRGTVTGKMGNIIITDASLQ